MIKALYIRMYQWLLRALYVQGVLAFIYIPIVIGWGLPISICSLIGNVLLTPFLCGFLIISSLVMLTHVIHIPNTWLAYGLDWYAKNWLHIMRLSTPDWLLGCPNPGIPWLIALSMTGLGLVWLVSTLRIEIRLSIIFALLVSCFMLYRYMAPTPQAIVIPYGKQLVSITYKDKHIRMLMPPVRTHARRFNRWCTFQLIPKLYKTWGTARIHDLVLVHPTKSFQATVQMADCPIHYQTLTLIGNDKKNHQSLLAQ